MPTLSIEQITKAASMIDPRKLADARKIASIFAREAASPGAGHVALALSVLDPIFGEDKTASLDGAGAFLSDTWQKIRPNVLGSLAGGAVMGGLGYGMASRLPGENDDDFSSRRNRFALTAGVGGMAVGAATPTILKSTGLDKKIEAGWNEATMTPEARAQKAQAEAAARDAQVGEQAASNAGSLAVLGGAGGAISSLRKTDEHFKAKQDVFKDKGEAMKGQRAELTTLGTQRADQIKASLDTQKNIQIGDQAKASLAEAQKALQTATAGMKNLRPGTPEHVAQQEIIRKAQQRVGSLTGQSAPAQVNASKARAIEAWLKAPNKTVPAEIAAADAKFITSNQRQVGNLTEQLARRGTGPSRAGVQTARTLKNTALGTVLALIAPHLWSEKQKVLPDLSAATNTFSPAK